MSYRTEKMDLERREFVLNGSCAYCGGLPNDCHEILAGAIRHKSYHERACWLRVCRLPCHGIVQSADIPWQLALKLLNDPEGFDLVKFHEAWGRPPTAVTVDDVLYALQEHLSAEHDRERLP